MIDLIDEMIDDRFELCFVTKVVDEMFEVNDMHPVTVTTVYYCSPQLYFVPQPPTL